MHVNLENDLPEAKHILEAHMPEVPRRMLDAVMPKRNLGDPEIARGMLGRCNLVGLHTPIFPDR